MRKKIFHHLWFPNHLTFTWKIPSSYSVVPITYVYGYFEMKSRLHLSSPIIAISFVLRCLLLYDLLHVYHKKNIANVIMKHTNGANNAAVSWMATSSSCPHPIKAARYLNLHKYYFWSITTISTFSSPTNCYLR